MQIVMGALVHSTRHKNSTYRKMVRWSIYYTRRLEHPYSSIRWYKWRPQGPASRPFYMESRPTWHNLHLRQQYHATSQSLQTANTLPLYQEPSHFRVLSYAISPVSYIKRFTPFTGSDLIWLNIFPGSDSVFPDLIWLKVFEWIQIFFPDSIRPKVFDWV